MDPTLTEIKINNLRSISMQKKLKFVPITILIGKNSVGKSTFARTFPLLRQSCEAKKRAPILWFGDRVDFGSYKKSIQRGATTRDEIEFVFQINDIALPNSKAARAARPGGEEDRFNADITLAIRSSGDQRSFASRVEIKCLGYEIIVRLSETNNLEIVQCSGVEWKPSVTDYTDASYEALLPKLTILREIDSVDKNIRYGEISPFHEKIAQKISMSRFENHEYLFNLVTTSPLLPRGRLINTVISRMKFLEKDFNSIDLVQFERFIIDIEPLVFGSKISELLAILDNSLRSYYGGVKYIEPLRATAQRYYRKQELAIDEIDSKGENLAMYLDNMGPWALQEFNDWTKENFGFTAKTTNEGGHVAIVIREEGVDAESNLADIGFGFSQILPVITQMWLSSRPNLRSKRTSCIVIEQPELHLHPSFQAKLADVFAASISGRKTAPHLIVETHSNHIVNRLGQLISEGKLKHEDVQILIFEKAGPTQSSIRMAGFDDDGYLVNWPLGFFEPEI